MTAYLVLYLWLCVVRSDTLSCHNMSAVAGACGLSGPASDKGQLDVCVLSVFSHSRSYLSPHMYVNCKLPISLDGHHIRLADWLLWSRPCDVLWLWSVSGLGGPCGVLIPVYSCCTTLNHSITLKYTCWTSRENHIYMWTKF